MIDPAPGSPVHDSAGQLGTGSCAGELRAEASVAVDLGLCLRTLEPQLRAQLGSDTGLVLQVGHEACGVNFEPAPLRQAITHLVLACRDAMSSGGTVTVSLGSELVELDDELARSGLGSGRWACLEIVGESSDMDDEAVDRMFAPFPTLEDQEAGCGWGVSRALDLLEAAGGQLLADRVSDCSSRLRVFVPRARRTEFAPELSGDPRPRTGDAPRLLVAEHDPASREMLRVMLEGSGYRVAVAENVSQALAMLEAPGSEFAALVTNVILPGLTGRQLAARFRERHPGRAILFLAGYGDDLGLGCESLDAHTRLLRRPFPPEQLDACLTQVLGSGETGA